MAEKLVVMYHHNNSGGRDWLLDEDWARLVDAGWKLTGFKSAYREGLELGAAIDEWERVLNMDSTAEGCSCCGFPHWFSEEPESWVGG
jgi:hypothetical protein